MNVGALLLALPLLHGLLLTCYHLFLVPPTPSHLTGPVAVLPDLLTSEQARSLRRLLREMGLSGLDSNLADSKATLPEHEHVGEAEPIGPNGTCSHPFLVPSLNRTECVLAQRIDIGKHYLTTGGVYGLKDTYDVSIGRLQSFGRYLFDLSEFPAVEELFGSRDFKEAAVGTCPAHKPLIDPFQFNLIIQVPGQTVATHVDGVYFLGADRFRFPQWLLTAMQFSGLFADRFIDQIQIVAYFHEWEPSSRPDAKGEFIYYPNGTKGDVLRADPTPRSGNAVDGSKVIHAAAPYYPGTLPPQLDKSKDNKLIFAGKGRWEIHSDRELVQAYKEDELRSTIVFRARCFEDEEAMARFKEKRPEDKLELEDIIETLKKGMGGWVEEGASRLDLALAILDHYVAYPPPEPRETLVPFNYCIVGKLFPPAKPLLKLACTDFD